MGLRPTIKIVDARAIIMGAAVDPRDVRFEPLFSSGSHKFLYFFMNLFLDMISSDRIHYISNGEANWL